MTHGNYYLAIGIEGINNADLLKNAVENVLFTSEELDSGWGFCVPMNLETMHEELMEGIWDDEHLIESADGCFSIKSSWPKLNQLIDLLHTHSPSISFYNFKTISAVMRENPAHSLTQDNLNQCNTTIDDFINYLNQHPNASISICEIDPP